jgi:hypothetical protein
MNNVCGKANLILHIVCFIEITTIYSGIQGAECEVMRGLFSTGRKPGFVPDFR